LIGTFGFEKIINDPRFAGITKMLETPKENDMDRKNLALLKRLGKKKANPS
ncbi:MAG: deoxyribonuclease IV, partial [Planctomycetota bacterium]